MNPSKSQEVTQTLQNADMHKEWEESYRNDQNIHFYELALTYIFRQITISAESSFLDAGCGSGTKSMLLAERGYKVTGVDISETVLLKAANKAAVCGLADKITFQPEDMTALSFSDETFDAVLCWGVLMHIPNVEGALSELMRVVKKGGSIIVSEGNMYSLQAVLIRAIKRLLRKPGENMILTPAGIETWTETLAGTYLTRQANIQWLIECFTQNGFNLKKHHPGQFTELYIRFSSPLIRKVIHSINSVWFNSIKNSSLAFGNILIFTKE